MNRESCAQLIVGLALLLPVLYVGSYFALVLPAPVVTGTFTPSIDHYRFGGRISKATYWPLETLDRGLRPETWKESPSEWSTYP